MKKNYFLFLISLLIVLVFPPPAVASCPPPFAKIDSISPHKSCLQITDATKFCGGRIAIFNNCFQTYTVDGKILLPRLAAFPLVDQKNWTITIKDATNSETVTVRGTSSKGNFTAKPYSVRISPTKTPLVKTTFPNTAGLSRHIPLLVTLFLIGVLGIVAALFTLLWKKRHPHLFK